MRLHTTAPESFFSDFVCRYHDKQYQTWLGGRFAKIGVDYNYDNRLQDRVYAGIANHFFGQSFSKTLSLVKDNARDNEIPVFEQKFDRIEKRFLTSADDFLSKQRPSLEDAHTPMVNAELFMIRLLTSFRAARYLINWGFFSEPLTILRSSLEQLAWCFSVGVRFNRDQLERPRPSKCISELKKRFPAAGGLYGILSDFSHMEFEAQKHFVTRENGAAGVMEQSTEFKFFGLICYAFLIIAYQYVCRDLSRIYAQHYGLDYRLNNTVLPLRYLIAHALFRPELDNDEIAARLSLSYFEIFP